MDGVPAQDGSRGGGPHVSVREDHHGDGPGEQEGRPLPGHGGGDEHHDQHPQHRRHLGRGQPR